MTNLLQQVMHGRAAERKDGGRRTRTQNTTPFLAELGSRIRNLRLEQGLSLDLLAEACGTSKGSLSSIENGLVNISVQTCVNIAEALDVDAADLLPSAQVGGKAQSKGSRA